MQFRRIISPAVKIMCYLLKSEHLSNQDALYCIFLQAPLPMLVCVGSNGWSLLGALDTTIVVVKVNSTWIVECEFMNQWLL